MDLGRPLPIPTPGGAPGETHPMQQHGPDDLDGPVRGTAAWWRGMGAPPDDVADGSPVTLRRPRRGVRADLVARARAAIAAGTYDTPARWEAALDRLLDRLDGR